MYVIFFSVSTQYTSLASANNLCKECDKITYTNKTLYDELALKVAELKKILTVDKEALSSTKRKKTSASDHRRS
jgi:5-enolpyruvylshikimate-3-phosphate synthase